MKSLFVATSYSGKVNYQTGEVLPEFRRPMEEILEALRVVAKLSVFCAAEHEGWKFSNQPPEVGVKKDLEEIEKADALLSLVDGVSEGSAYERGFATRPDKTVIIAHESETKLDYFSQGLVKLGVVKHVVYETPNGLAVAVSHIVESTE